MGGGKREEGRNNGRKDGKTVTNLVAISSSYIQAVVSKFCFP